jgi:prepilin-type N-terminal cleavage/methylation domain-containing protein
MKVRAGVTLIEVLVAIFIMAIGLLALLTLFPLGALSMAQAIKDQRVSEGGQQANAFANALNIRSQAGFTSSSTTGPSSPVFIDPWGKRIGMPGTVGGVAGGVSRIELPLTSTPPNSLANTMRYYGLQDELTFADNGTLPDPTSGGIQRDPKTTWAYWLRCPNSSNPNVVEMSIVVYFGRNLQLGSAEIPVTNILYTAGTPNSVGVPSNTDIRRGMWIVDVTTGTNSKAIRGQWYRVVDTVDAVGGIQLDLQPQPAVAMQNLIIMEDVAEVFYKGTGR